MPTLTLLISDQTIPNLLFLKEFGDKAEKVLFITTAAMQRKGKIKNLLDASGITLPFETIELDDENDPTSVEKAFRNKLPNPNDHWVNLTCGNKIMFLVANNYFRLGNNRLLYMPIGKNYFMNMTDSATIHIIKTRLMVKEYLLAHGITPLDEEPVVLKDFKVLKLVLKEYKQSGFDVNTIIESRDDPHKGFFTGGWFEQYIYYRIKEQFRLGEGFIELGVKVNNFGIAHRAGNDNEFDIVFTFNNELYVIEAKVAMGKGKNRRQQVENVLFKLGALNRNFGLRSHAWLVTLSDLNEESETYLDDLARKIRVIGIEGIRDRNDLLKSGSKVL